jgi:hypothetical protein
MGYRCRVCKNWKNTVADLGICKGIPFNYTFEGEICEDFEFKEERG